MNNFSFHSPTEFVFGKDTEKQTGLLCKKYGATRVLIVYGGGSVVRSGLLQRVEQSLEDAGISYVELGGIQPNPTDPKVYEGIDLARRERVDMLLPIGGGSVIDTAENKEYALYHTSRRCAQSYRDSRGLVPYQGPKPTVATTMSAVRYTAGFHKQLSRPVVKRATMPGISHRETLLRLRRLVLGDALVTIPMSPPAICMKMQQSYLLPTYCLRPKNTRIPSGPFSAPTIV